MIPLANFGYNLCLTSQKGKVHLELKSMKYVFLEVLLEKFAIFLIHRKNLI